MNSDTFFRAAIPDPFTVLGLKLRPFSAGHLILLHRIESAFVVGGPHQLPDLISSVFLCSLDYRSGVESLDSQAVDKFMSKWQRKIGQFDFVDKRKLFERYVEEGSAEPSWTAKGDGATIAAPKVQVVKVRLLSSMHMTENEFLNRPWTLSLWDYYTLYALEGALTIVEPGAVDSALAVANSLDAKLNARKGEPCQN